MECAYSEFRDLVRNFTGLKLIPLQKTMVPNFETTILAHPRLLPFLNNNNIPWSFVCKMEQVYTYV